jgi:tRNA-specific 2-thiouridylase
VGIVSKVAVAMSGGVDSSVAAAILKKQGHDVIGVTMEIWNGGTQGSEGKKHSCYSPEEKKDTDDARRIAEILEIPFYVFDLREIYKSVVLDHFCSEYLLGRTPNPCIRCNRYVKLDALFKKTQDMGFDYDYMATGHYARVEYNKARRRYLLKKAKDIAKDQSYFLYSLSQKQLDRLLFPVGNFAKVEIREIADELNLSVHHKPESQNFINGGYHQLVDDYAREGPILDKQENILGQHKGIQFYTIGQRKKLGISMGKPMYVIALDYQRNAVIIGSEKDLYGDELIASDVNLIATDRIRRPIRIKAKIRYTHKAADAVITSLGRNKIHLRFQEPQSAITPGQAVVFYDNDYVLGGGVIGSVIASTIQP